IADRVDLRRLLIGTQLAFGLLAGLLWALAVAGKASVPVIVAISVAGGPRAALLTGAAACLAAAGIASRVHTPPHPDAALTDLDPS
ncbi:MAG TPA: hypothetical protein VIZ43_11830, partial [Trebonia sp.]